MARVSASLTVFRSVYLKLPCNLLVCVQLSLVKKTCRHIFVPKSCVVCGWKCAEWRVGGRWARPGQLCRHWVPKPTVDQVALLRSWACPPATADLRARLRVSVWSTLSSGRWWAEGALGRACDGASRPSCDSRGQPPLEGGCVLRPPQPTLGRACPRRWAEPKSSLRGPCAGVGLHRGSTAQRRQCSRTRVAPPLVRSRGLRPPPEAKALTPRGLGLRGWSESCL